MTTAALAADLDLQGLGPVPPELPDAWLHALERRAAALENAAQAAEHDRLLGHDAPPAARYLGLARRWLLTDRLEAACEARIPLETGFRRRWLEVLRAEAEALRLALDPEANALTEATEKIVWAFKPPPADPDADPSVVARRRIDAALPVAAELRGPLLALVRRRNALARAAGDADYYATRCRLQGMDAAWSGPLLDALEAVVAPAMRALVAQLGLDAPALWQLRGAMHAHGGGLPADRLPAVGRAALDRADAALGLAPLGARLKVDVGPFAAGGLCSAFDPATDIRLVIADWLLGALPVTVLLHEYGHARHAAGMADAGHPHHLAAMMKGAPAPVCEAIAILFETLVDEPAFLADACGATPAEIAAWRPHARRWRLFTTAFQLYEARFEQALYADPDADADALRAAMARRVMGVELGDEAKLWATSRLLGSFPAHNTAYLLAGMAAAQLRAARGGTLWGDPSAGAWLTSAVIAPAGTRPWRALIAEATGAELGVAALRSEIA